MSHRIEIPVSYPDLTGNEEAYVVEAIRSSWISSTGAFIDRFERDFAQSCNSRACITVANGTVALHLALLALGVGPGDEVIVPSLTYIATANAVRYVGATPIFADVDPTTWCIDPNHVRALVGKRTKGVIAVHLYGHPADMDALKEIADGSGMWIVEDAAEAHFATYKNRPVGGLGTCGMFSFYGNKIITSGEGGALTLNSPDLERRARLLRGQGMDPERRYYFPVVGYNYRLTNVAAAFLCAQHERRDQIVERRRRIFSLYDSRLRDIPGISLQPTAPWAVPAPWLYSIVIDPEFGLTRDALANKLLEEGIDTRPFFQPVHKLPPYRDAAKETTLSVTDALAGRGMNLPTFSQMTEDIVDTVCSSIIRLRH